MTEEISQRAAREAIDTLRYLVRQFEIQGDLDDLNLAHARKALAIFDAERAATIRPTHAGRPRLIAAE